MAAAAVMAAAADLLVGTDDYCKLEAALAAVTAAVMAAVMAALMAAAAAAAADMRMA